MRQFIADVHNRSEEGATAAEYVFLLIFVAIAATLGMALLGNGLLTQFSAANDDVTAVTPSGSASAPALP